MRSYDPQRLGGSPAGTAVSGPLYGERYAEAVGVFQSVSADRSVGPVGPHAVSPAQGPAGRTQ